MMLYITLFNEDDDVAMTDRITESLLTPHTSVVTAFCGTLTVGLNASKTPLVTFVNRD